MRAVFVQLQCQPGKTYEVADALFERMIHERPRGAVRYEQAAV